MRLNHLTDSELQTLLDISREPVDDMSDVRAHLSACSGCQKEYELYSEIAQRLSCCELEPLPNNFVADIMKKLPPLPGHEPWRKAVSIGTMILSWLSALAIILIPFKMEISGSWLTYIGHKLASITAGLLKIVSVIGTSMSTEQAAISMMAVVAISMYLLADRAVFKAAYRRVKL